MSHNPAYVRKLLFVTTNNNLECKYYEFELNLIHIQSFHAGKFCEFMPLF